ncbi:T9SS type A sorting domain-containing protein [candidate division KSB1 bacterium]|nr:T9SS type A sorting domain-containing protein [candidate division KSB1 bacterium]
MRLKIVSVVLLVLFSFAHTTERTSGFYQKTFPDDVKILASDSVSLLLEINVPKPQVKPSAVNGVAGSSLQLSGYTSIAEPGAPALPIRAIPMAVPPGAQLSIDILDIEEVNENINELAPAPTFVPENLAANKSTGPRYAYPKNELIYEQNRFYPEAHVQLGAQGKMRGLNICSVLFYPVRYNPVIHQIKRVTRIVFSVHFHSTVLQHRQTTYAQESTAFQTIYANTLVNSHYASAWQTPSVSMEKAQAYFLQEGQDWIKIALEKNGLYHISAAELGQAGLAITSVDPRTLKLFNHNEQVAILVEGESDGVFDENDYLEFYGEAFKNQHTTTNIYWLTASPGLGKRMQSVDAAPVHGYPQLDVGRSLLRYEIDYCHHANFPNHTDQDHWFMDSLFAPKALSYPVDLGRVEKSPDAKAEFAVHLQGFASMVAYNPDHHTLVNINGTTIWDKWWEGRISVADTIRFDQSLLQDGINHIDFIGPDDTGSFLDWQLIDYFALKYTRINSTTNDSLVFSIEQAGQYNIQANGFAADVNALDISDSKNPIYITGLLHNNDQISFEYTINEPSYFYLTAASRTLAPIRLERDAPSNLRQTVNRADYLIITYDDFYQATVPLANFHTSNGLEVMIIKVQDIYDEFSAGIYDKNAIKDFLAYTYANWAKPAPTFVLLVGDASWNPRMLRPENEFYGGGRKSDFVPTRLFEADVEHAQATSDTWFGCLDGDNDVLPEFLIGRLTARSTIEAHYMVQKILDYATQYESGAWHNTATFVADVGEGGSNAFEDSSDAYIRRYIPSDFIANRIYLSELGMPNTKNAIFQAFGQGCLTLNYFGHGAASLWSDKLILSRDDVPFLPENVHLPFVFTMSCINGYFADPSAAGAALGEKLVTEVGKGALAVFTGSGKAYASILQPLAHILYYTLYTETKPQIGVFSTAGLLAMFSTFPQNLDHVRFYVLFGDPATSLHYTHAGPARQYAWYSGYVTIEDKVPPAQSELLAFIDERQFSSGRLNASDGSFGPIYIPEDNPATSEKDGGMAGDSVYFKIQQSDNRAHLLEPAVAWRLGATDSLHLKEKPTHVENMVSVQFFVDGRKVGQDFYDGDPISLSSTIIAEVELENVVLAKNNFTLAVNNEKIDNEIKIRLVPSSPARNKLVLSYSPQNLADGNYEIQLVGAGVQHQGEPAGFRFFIQSAIGIDNVVNFPNPFQDKTTFTYIIKNDQPVAVDIKIYTVAGRLIQTLEAPFSDVGYNELEWDGCDAYGDALANGVYFYKICARDRDEHTEVIERLIIMR